MILAGVAYGGVLGYLGWRESSASSTSRILVLKDGRQIPLKQPTPAALILPQASPIPGLQTNGLPQQAPQFSLPVSSSLSPPKAELLPPLKVKMPSIGVNWPVVLADNDHMPRFKGVGWMMGTAFPGQVGNMVLFGHLDGPYATLGRLSELKPGDIFSVTTDDGEFSYVVRESYQTTPDDVSVLAPTDSATATIITCSGQWDILSQNYSNRLIVKADYISP